MKDGIRQLRLLVVDDNKINRIVATRFLEKSGHVVETAENGNEALSKLKENTFDIVFMDIQMPEMDGIEATRRIREDSEMIQARDVPIIAMTAHVIQGDRERFLQAGMNGYIPKPITRDDLLVALRPFEM